MCMHMSETCASMHIHMSETTLHNPLDHPATLVPRQGWLHEWIHSHVGRDGPHRLVRLRERPRALLTPDTGYIRMNDTSTHSGASPW